MRKTILLIGVLGFAVILLVIASVYIASRVSANARRIRMVEAVEKGDVTVVRELVEHNPSLVDAEWRDRLGMFPDPVLSISIRLKRKEVAEFLIRKGANVKRKDGLLGRTPLHFAAEWGDVDVIRLLLEKGADPNDAGGGVTPIIVAVHAGNRHAITFLKANGAKPGSRIHEAAAFGDLQTVKKELARDPKLISLEEYKSRPLDLAAKHGRISVVSYLIAKGASIDPRALLYAAESGQLETVRVLLLHGADVNGKGGLFNYTPLHAVAETGNTEVAAYLLAHGADPSIESSGYTAVELAEEKGHKDMASLLRKHVHSSTKSPSRAASEDK